MNPMARALKTALKSATESRFFRSCLHRIDYDLAPFPVKPTEPGESLAHHLRDVFDATNTTCVLDVGANNGHYGAFLRRIGYTGKIVSFEPVRRSFDQLMLRAREDPNWFCHNAALGEVNAEREIGLRRHSVFDSFLTPNEYSSREFGQDSELIGSETVLVHRLDAILEDCVGGTDHASVFLKMDTQGYDLKVIEGAAGCIESILGVQSELSVKPIYDGMPGYLDVIPLLNRLGFEITGLFPVNRDSWLRVIEFDCVAIRVGARNGV